MLKKGIKKVVGKCIILCLLQQSCMGAGPIDTFLHLVDFKSAITWGWVRRPGSSIVHTDSNAALQTAANSSTLNHLRREWRIGTFYVRIYCRVERLTEHIRPSPPPTSWVVGAFSKALRGHIDTLSLEECRIFGDADQINPEELLKGVQKLDEDHSQGSIPQAWEDSGIHGYSETGLRCIVDLYRGGGLGGIVTYSGICKTCRWCMSLYSKPSIYSANPLQVRDTIPCFFSAR